MAKLKLLSTIFSKLSTLGKNDGQVIVSKDSKSLYVDLDGERIEVTDWIDINTEEALLAILTPLTNKYYYTKDSNKIWRYVNSEWICLNNNINDQSPIYAESTSLVKLSSGEKLSIAFGKISKAITDLISHIGDSTKHITSTERTNWNSAKTHADSAHARTDATKVEKSSTNGNIKINGTETNVYTHPSGTNPHGTTKSDVGLGNVGNFKAVSTVANQGLSSAEKANARANIGAGTSSFSGSYNDLTNKPTIPTNNNQLTNGAGYITSLGTAKTISDTLPISKGGTGKTTGIDAANVLINSLTTGDATPTDADYYVSQYAGGGTNYTTYHRRPMSALWNYIKSKLATVATSGSYNDLTNKPTIPSVGNGTVTIKQAGTSKGTFTMNQTGNTTIELTDNNTWRGIQNNLTSTSTTDSLSANQGKILNETKVGFAKVTASEIAKTNNNPFFGNVENEDIGIGNGKFYSVINLGSYSGGNFRSQIAMPYQDSITESDMYIRTDKNGTWRPWRKIIHSGNIGSQSVNYATSAGNADTVDGFHASQTAGSKSTCVVTDSNGYTNLNYINSNTGNNENPSISQVIVTNGSDNYYRKASLSHLKSSLGSMPASDVYAWAKASSKPSYSWSEITSKPSTFTPASHTHDYLPLSGGTLNGQIHFNNNSLPAFDGSIPYLVGIESFADGGTLKWQSASSVSVGYATSAGNADTVDGHHFNWSGQGGQPTWIWGGNDSSNMYVYNPSNFSVNYANGSGTVKGSYTGNGGQQNPNYFGVNKVGFLMMNTTVNGDNHYKDWIIMDCYSGSDVGGATAIGVDRQEMRAFIMGSDADRTSWTRSAELITTANISSQSVNYANSAGSAPANGGTSTFANNVWTQSHNGSWYINSNWNGNYFVTNAKTSDGSTLPIYVDNSGRADTLSGFTNTTTSATAVDNAVQNGHVYVNDTSGIVSQYDGACYVQAYSASWVHQIYGDYRTGQIAVRGKNNGTWQAWRKILDSSNYTSYAATKDHTHTTATTSLNGFMSSSDKSKLDSIEEGATARTGALTIRMREKDSTLEVIFTGKIDKTISFNNWEIGTTSGTVCAGNDSRLSNARPASDVYAWAKASTPDGIFDGGTYKGNIDSYTESTLRPGKSYYISTTNISSSSVLPFSGYGILTSYAAGSAIVQQIFRYNGSSKIIDAIYTRMYINSGWTSWSRVALTKV